jgi:hypothetical protein
MLQARGEPPVDGVIAVDVVALRNVLDATGPIMVDGAPVDAERVEQLLLHDQYAGTVAEATSPARRDRLAAIAAGVVSAIGAGDANIVKLAGRIADAAAGRHVAVWSADPTRQRAWHDAGVDGTLRPDDVLVSVMNRSGSKMDQFLDVDVKGSTARRGRDTTVRLDISLTNRAGPSEPPYIAGYEPEVSGVQPGDYGGILAVNFPAYAGAITLTGTPNTVAAGADGSSEVIAGPAMVPRGRSAHFTMTFTLRGQHGTFRVAPSARVPPARWTVDGEEFTDAVGHQVRW